MMFSDQLMETKPQKPAHEPRFGVRVPRNGAPIPFRVLISTRWLSAGFVAGIALLAALFQLPRKLRLPLALGGSGAIGGGALLAAVAQARRLAFEHLTLPIKDLPPALDGFTIVQLSDLHLGSPFTPAHIRRTVAWVRQRQPDLVVFTGDFISFTDKIPLLCEHLDGLCARYGVYAILGNHDYWTDLDALQQVLDRHRIDLLRNEQRQITVGDAMLHLVGVDCVWEAQHDLPLALGDLPKDATVVVLAHEPDIADEIAEYDVALQLSGHTHAGHIALPFLGPLFLPRHGLRYYRGLQRIGRMWLYVSRGMGGIPLRLGGPPEVTEITLRRDETTDGDQGD